MMHTPSPLRGRSVTAVRRWAWTPPSTPVTQRHLSASAVRRAPPPLPKQQQQHPQMQDQQVWPRLQHWSATRITATRKVQALNRGALDIETLVEHVVSCIPVAPVCSSVSVIYRRFLHDDVWECILRERGSVAPHPDERTRAPRPSSEGAAKQRVTAQRMAALKASVGSIGALLDTLAGENVVSEVLCDRERGRLFAHGVYMSFDQLHATIATSAEEAGRAFAVMYTPLTVHTIAELDSRLTAPSKEGHSSSGFRYADLCWPTNASSAPLMNQRRKGLNTPPALLELHARRNVVAEVFRLVPAAVEPACGGDVYMPYFGDDFVPPPELPAAVAASPSSTAVSRFTPAMLAAVLPTHFVPMEALLQQLPHGYTAEHVRRIFGEMAAVESVTLAGATYIRLFGGKGGEAFAQQAPNTGGSHGEDARDDGDGDDEDADGVEQQQQQQQLPSSSAGNQERQCIAAYEPDPYLIYAFLQQLGRPYEWVPLYTVVERAAPAAQAALLPLREHSTLLYFAQMSQFVGFTPQHGGAVCHCYPPTRTLRAETTPLPQELAEVHRMLHTRGLVFVSEIEAGRSYRLRSRTKRRIIAHFGTLRRFLFQHESTFRLSVVPSDSTTAAASAAAAAASPVPTPAEPGTLAVPPPPTPTQSLPRGSGFAVAQLSVPSLLDGSTAAAAADPPSRRLDADGFPCWLASADLAVMCECVALLQERRASPDEQSSALTGKWHRTKERKLMRRMALADNPNSPYTDPEVLLDAVLRYLPPTQHVGLRAFIRALPLSLTVFLPVPDAHRLFRNAPTKVQLFEYRKRNNLRLLRIGVPLPEGVLRSTYTVEEIMFMMASELPLGRTRSSMDLFSRLPYGARETVRLRHHHIADIAEQYPQYFIVVHQDAEAKLKHTSRIQLIQMPPAPTTLADTDWDASGVEDAAQMEAAVEQDHALLARELPQPLLDELTLVSKR
ncbi:hypothetical protein NESM_000232400 [Novymonas esmeraldas]|uniref:Uncharacterized protein n=1 Tax=Novymonas esmeraldas TaxID=1808958 RepID=A0AAW0F660_9TRYP